MADEKDQDRIPTLKIKRSAWHIDTSDAVEWLNTLPEGCADLVVTDPPYESLEKHRKKGTTTRLTHSNGSSNDWFSVFPNDRFDELAKAVYRVNSKNSHAYFFSDQETMFYLKPALERAGYKFWKPLVWDKAKIGMGYHYRARYEFILFCEKGKRRLSDLSVPDVLKVPRIFRGHPAEKPVELIQTLIRQSSEEKQLVIDPFCGSGSTGVAALLLGRKFWGNDLGLTIAKVAKKRLRQTKEQMRFKETENVEADEK